MSGRTVLVTGGAGFIGSHLVGALLARGDRVIVTDNLSVGSRDNLADYAGDPRMQLHVVDVLDRDPMRRLLDGVDCVFHLAAHCVRMSLFDPERVHRVNTEGTLRLLMAATEARVKRFVYVSSSEAFGSARTVPMAEEHPFEPTTIYGASKLAGEHYTTAYHRAQALEAMVVRPFNTYGPRAHFEGARGEVIPKFVVRALNGQRPILFGGGEQTRDFTYVSDTVHGLLLAADSDVFLGRSVNIARGIEVSIGEIARLVLEACGRTDIEPELGPARPSDVRRHYADVTRARQEIGFDPQVDIADGIRHYVEWFRRTYPDPAKLLVKEQPYNWLPAPAVPE